MTTLATRTRTARQAIRIIGGKSQRASSTAFRRLNIHFRTLANLVGPAANDRVAFLEQTEDLDEIADACAAADIDPLGDTVGDTNDEGTLGRRDNARWRHKQ